MAGVPLKGGDLDTETGTEGRQCEGTQKEDGHRARSDAGNRPLPHGLQKEPTTPAPRPQTAGLPNWEATHSRCCRPFRAWPFAKAAPGNQHTEARNPGSLDHTPRCTALLLLFSC